MPWSIFAITDKARTVQACQEGWPPTGFDKFCKFVKSNMKKLKFSRRKSRFDFKTDTLPRHSTICCKRRSARRWRRRAYKLFFNTVPPLDSFSSKLDVPQYSSLLTCWRENGHFRVHRIEDSWSASRFCPAWSWMLTLRVHGVLWWDSGMLFDRLNDSVEFLLVYWLGSLQLLSKRFSKVVQFSHVSLSFKHRVYKSCNLHILLVC